MPNSDDGDRDGRVDDIRAGSGGGVVDMVLGEGNASDTTVMI